MEYVIRAAVVEDAPAMARVHVESWRTTYSGIVPDAYLASLSVDARIELWREHLAAGNSPIFVAEASSGVFGFASGGPLRAALSGYHGELYAIYLLREHQRQGAGRCLVRALAESLRGAGFASMAVWVLERNPAVSFYKALGGVQIARQPIEIGGAALDELAFGWPSLDDFLAAHAVYRGGYSP